MKKRFALAILGAALIAVLAWLAWRWSSTPAGPSAGAARPDSATVGFESMLLFFAAPSGDSLVAEPREMLEAATLHDRVHALISELERGPRRGGARAIPAGTSLVHAYLDESGTLTVDLDRAFRSGFHGGAGAEFLGVGSLARTLAANVRDVHRVRVVCEGQPLASLGGHLPLDRPIEVPGAP